MVLRRRFPRAAAGIVAGLVVAGVAPAGFTATSAAGEAPPDEEHAPLLVTLEELTPGYLPDSGPIEVRGTVTNADVVTWEGITVYPFFDNDQVPVTSSAELAEASLAEDDAYVGDRILPGENGAPESVADRVGDIAPGESVSYSLTVPRSAFAGKLGVPGAYWFGVHALGASEASPDDGEADGRARTFLPYVGRRSAADPVVEAAVVVPIRRRVAHTPAGAVARPSLWARDLEPEGTLGSLLEFGRAAGGQPVTWLVDPAVPDAVRQLVRGNPGRPLGTPAGPDGEDGESASTDPSDPSDEPDGGTEESDGSEDEPELSALPIDGPAMWLDDLQRELESSEVLELPYGDVDLAGAAESDPSIYERARDQPSVLDDWDVSATLAMGSPGGYLDGGSLALADDASLALLTDDMFAPEQFPNGAPAGAVINGHDVAVTSSAAASGGPGPDPTLSPVQLRQRILSEAALRLVRRDPAPLVVMLPTTVDPADADEFWSGLDADWLDLGTVSDAVSGDADEIDVGDLSYPQGQEDYELPDYVYDEARELVASGESLQRLLTGNTSVGTAVRAEALTAASYSMRPDPASSVASLRAAREWIAGRQGGVRISAPPGVTLSSSDGSFSVTVANRLRHPVTVQIEAGTDSDIAIDTGEPIELAPRPPGAKESRTTVVLGVHTGSLGVHNVRLALVDSEGTPLGATAKVPVRSGQVGEVIWWITGSGLAVLFIAITIRLTRRIARARRESAETSETSEQGEKGEKGEVDPAAEPVSEDAS